MNKHVRIGYPDIQRRATSRECELIPNAVTSWLNMLDGPRDPGFVGATGQDIRLVLRDWNGPMLCDYFAIIEAKRMGIAYNEMRVTGYDTKPELPTAITGLVGWYDADDLTSISQTAGKVDQWSDKSGNSNHATQTSSARPDLVPNTATGNTRGAISFAGAQHWLACNGLAATFSGANLPYTIFAVAKQNTQGSVNDLFCASNSGSNRPLRNLFKATPAILRSTEGNNAGSSASVSDSNVGLLNFDVVAVRGSGTSSQLFVNGTQTATNATSLGATTINQCVIGARRILTTMSSFWDGLISEILIYNSALSDADIARANNYLQVKHQNTVFYDIDISPNSYKIGRYLKDQIYTRETPANFSNYEISIPYTSGPGKYPSKLFLGKFLEVDSDPEVQIDYVSNTRADTEGAGNVYTGSQFVDQFKVTLSYFGLTSAELADVREKVIKQPKGSGFVLYNPTNRKLFQNTDLIYAALTDYSIRSEYVDHFDVTLTFTEFMPI
jgi:hypothetical protein